MNVAVLEPLSAAGHSLAATGLVADRLAAIVLVRVATATSRLTCEDVARDLHPIVSHKVSPADWARAAAGLLGSLQAQGQVVQSGARYSATASGRSQAAAFLGAKKQSPGTWSEAWEIGLVAKALGLEKEPVSRLKALAKLDGLRALIVLATYQLKVRGKPSPSRLRTGLAMVALERAFGNQIKSGLGDKPGLSAKSGRLLAGQLSQRPRDFGTDGRLVAALAAEAVGAQRSDLAALRAAVLRRFVTGEAARPTAPQPAAPRRARRKKMGELGVLPRPAPAPAPAPQAERVSVRPDPAGFARAVQAAARPRAEGWPGNRKTFISHAWETVRDQHPEWALTEIEFKCMLTEAHRAGLLALAGADLKHKRNLKELQDSAVSYKNTVWHYIRVDD